MGVIKYLALFLGMLPEPCRVSYLPLLHDILHSTNPFNWRLRQYLAVQLPDLVALPPKNELFRTVFPLVMILLQDPVASVRRDSFRGVTCLINNLYDLVKTAPTGPDYDANLVYFSKQNLEEIARAINTLVTGEKYQLRQLWVELCHQLLRDLPRELFEHYFVHGILALTCDTVSNVRVAMAYFLVDWGSENLPPWETAEVAAASGHSDASVRSETPWHWLLRRPDVRECVTRLARDDNDVFLNLVRLQPLFPDVAFSSVSCRGYKSPPGGLVPIVVNPVESASETAAQNFCFDDDSRGDNNTTDAHSEDNSVSGYSSSGFNVGVVADIHVNSNRSSFSSNNDDDAHSRQQSTPHGMGLADMSAIDIDFVPRSRASSFPTLEFVHGNGGSSDSSLPAEIDEELDIIDGLIRSSPKHVAARAASPQDSDDTPLANNDCDALLAASGDCEVTANIDHPSSNDPDTSDCDQEAAIVGSPLDSASPENSTI